MNGPDLALSPMPCAADLPASDWSHASGIAGWSPPERSHAALPAVRQLPATCLSALLDELDSGIVLCDEGGHALLFNEAARRELAHGGVLRLGGDGRLEVEGDANLQPLRAAIQSAAVRGLRQLVPLRSGNNKLMVAVQPLRDDAGAAAHAVLLLGRRQLCPDLVVEMLSQLHELTPAERRVLNGLIAGHSVVALAQRHGVAISTIRTQVAALRSKFGVARIDDLMLLVAEMPPMANVLRTPLPRSSRPERMLS